MADKKTVYINVDSNIKSVTKDTDDFNKSLDNTNKEAENAAENFAIMGVSLNTIKTGFTKAMTAAKGMFSSVKAGLISTGIGAFVIAIGSLVSYFRNTKEGAEEFRRIADALGASFSILVDKVSDFGGAIVAAFKDPKQAVIDLWEALKKNLVNRVEGLIDSFQAAGKVIKGVFEMDWDAVAEGAKEYGQAIIQIGTGYDTAAQAQFLQGLKDTNTEFKNGLMLQYSLTKQKQELNDEERKFIVRQAKTRRTIQKSRLDALDDTKTAQERLDALKKANELEIKTTNRAIAMQQKRVNIKRKENDINKSLEEDLNELANLEVTLINLKTQSFQTQKRLATEMETLNNEIKAAAKQKAKEEAEANKLKLKTQEIDDKAWAELKMKRIKDETNEEFEIRIKAARKLAEEEAKAKIDAEKAVADVRQATADQEMTIASQVVQVGKILAGENEGLQKALIAADAAVAIGKTIITTQAANAAIVAQGAALAIPTGGASVAAASAAVTANNISAGLSIAAITAGAGVAMSKLGGGGSVGGGAIANTQSETPSPEMMGGSFELTGGRPDQPIQAYVVSDDITNSQNGLAQIRRRATI